MLGFVGQRCTRSVPAGLNSGWKVTIPDERPRLTVIAMLNGVDEYAPAAAVRQSDRRFVGLQHERRIRI
jgi:hypothetical protein